MRVPALRRDSNTKKTSTKKKDDTDLEARRARAHECALAKWEAMCQQEPPSSLKLTDDVGDVLPPLSTNGEEEGDHTSAATISPPPRVCAQREFPDASDPAAQAKRCQAQVSAMVKYVKTHCSDDRSLPSASYAYYASATGRVA